MSAGFVGVFSPLFVVIGGHIIDKSCQSIRIFAVKVEVDGENGECVKMHYAPLLCQLLMEPHAVGVENQGGKVAEMRH